MLLPLRGPVRKIPSPFMEGVFFVKPFKTLDEQVHLLQERGLAITDIDRTKNYLLSNNYYNIINGYGKYFPRKGDTFTGGTTFDEVSRLYLLDKELKQAFFKAIIEAESHLKAVFAYRFAEAYPNMPYAYLNIANYANDKALSVVSTIYQLSGIINRQQRFPDNSIQHYVKTHGDVPVWVLVNYLDFGKLRHMITSSKTSLQNIIAKDMGSFIRQHVPSPKIFPPETMLSFIENINDIRNICAHNNRLLGFSCRRDSKYWASLHQFHGIGENDQKRNVFSVFLTLQCFLSRIEYAALHNKTRKLMHAHLKHIPSLPADQILSLLGFPAGWHISTPKIIV